jgi:hypothetical protein
MQERCQMNLEVWIAGYHDGCNGLPPTVPDAMHDNEELESTKPNVFHDPDWVWRIMGWTAGRAVARDETARLDGE